MAPATTAAAPVPNAIVPTLASQPQNRAYVTFLAGNGDYVDGIVGQVKGLRKVETKYELVVAVLPDVPEKARKTLKEQGCIVREIEPLYPPENQTPLAKDYLAINYSKLRIWEFVDYNKMIYLNCDIQVYGNIDHLFDLPNGRFYAVKDCFCERTLSHTLPYENGYCQLCPDQVPWPEAERGPRPAPYFNAGMFMFEPSLPKYTYRDLFETLKDTPPTTSFQDFLNKCFQDIYSPIEPFYNLVLPMLWKHPKMIGLDNVRAAVSGRRPSTRREENVERVMENWLEKFKVVQYCAPGSKPWSYNKKEENMGLKEIEMLVKKWWEIYDNVSLNFENSEAPVARGGAGEPAAVPGGLLGPSAS